ncbi:MAG TPA: DNA-processing protein DprA [Polyangiaceae bacterium]|nr:DNA-processing protein DprA [Polyangiaceae bacterium]
MGPPRYLTALDRDYPSRLRGLWCAPQELTVRGGSLEADRAVAVIGSRAAVADAVVRTRALCCTLAARGVVIVSGGAIGIDAAAHRAALDAAGRTWAIAATGPDQCAPACHTALFDEIAAGPGAVLWPFRTELRQPPAFLRRNRVLAMLVDAVIVMQAADRSGALHAAGCARRLGKPVWVAEPAARTERFAGSRQLLERGARPLGSVDALLSSLDDVQSAIFGPMGASDGADAGLEIAVEPGSSAGWSDPPLDPIFHCRNNVLDVLSSVSLHIDHISLLAKSSAQATAAALLTLALENVVVEGPPGFFRRRNSR